MTTFWATLREFGLLFVPTSCHTEQDTHFGNWHFGERMFGTKLWHAGKRVREIEVKEPRKGCTPVSTVRGVSAAALSKIRFTSTYVCLTNVDNFKGKKYLIR